MLSLSVLLLTELLLKGTIGGLTCVASVPERTKSSEEVLPRSGCVLSPTSSSRDQKRLFGALRSYDNASYAGLTWMTIVILPPPSLFFVSTVVPVAVVLKIKLSAFGWCITYSSGLKFTVLLRFECI